MIHHLGPINKNGSRTAIIKYSNGEGLHQLRHVMLERRRGRRPYRLNERIGDPRLGYDETESACMED